jgi:hypothetical protein
MPFDTEAVAELSQPDSPPEPAPPEPAPQEAEAPRRGRPWVKGQSGNPSGRPTEAQLAATIAHALIDRKAAALTRKLIEFALKGDPTALRVCFDRLIPPRRDTPALLPLPSRISEEDTRQALTVLTNPAALTPAQREALLRLVKVASALG